MADPKIAFLCSDNVGKQLKQSFRKSENFILTDNAQPLILKGIPQSKPRLECEIDDSRKRHSQPGGKAPQTTPVVTKWC